VKRLASMVLGMLTLLLVVVGGAGPASAHTRLVSTTPVNGAEVDASPNDVTLTFNEPVREKYSEVVVTGPEGGTWQVGKLTQAGSTISQALVPLGPKGTYTVAWRVVSADGHPVAGTFSFVLTTAGEGKPQTPGTAPAVTGGVSWLAAAGGLVGVAVLLVGGAVVVRRRQAHARVGRDG
jgi:copper resistance protein C